MYSSVTQYEDPPTKKAKEAPSEPSHLPKETQTEWYGSKMCSLRFVIPTLIPAPHTWSAGRDLGHCSILAVIVRSVFMLNATFGVNSFAHMAGNKAYNKLPMRSTENPCLLMNYLYNCIMMVSIFIPWIHRNLIEKSRNLKKR